MSAHFCTVERSLPGCCQGGGPQPTGVAAWKSGGCSHLHPLALQLEHSCPQGADPTEEGLPMFRRRDAQAHQVSAKNNGSDPAAQAPSLCLDREQPGSGPAGPPVEAGAGPWGPPTHCAVMVATASRLP